MLPSMFPALCMLLPPLFQPAAQEPISRGAERLAAWEQHVAMAATSPFAALPWRALGPKNCGGRVEGIDSPTGQPSVVYAGVGSGGVWKSTNGGLSWEHVFARESTCAIGDVTVDPSAADTVWVGTGEAHLGGKSYDGTGVFKSIDGGATWRNMGLVDSARIGKVLVNPRRSEVVYVAAIGRIHGEGGQRGVYKSEDGGETWARSLFVGEGVAIIDLVQDPFDPERLWAAAWDRTRGGRGGVFRTDDGGANWKQLEGGLLTGPPVGRVAIAAAASEAGVLYALIVDHSPPGEGRYDVGGALFRSTDGGDTWQRTSQEYVDTYVGWDFCDVMVAPDNPDEVYVCGMRLMVSRDGGQSFERGGETVFRLHGHPGRGMHLDMHDLWIDPQNPDRILLGTDGGLYASMDRAKSWLHLNNLPIAEFYTVFLEEERSEGAEPFRIWGGTQDNASLLAPSTATLSDARSDDWRYVFLDNWDGGDGFATFPDPSGDGTEYYEQQNGEMRRKRPGAPLRWNRDSGRRITPEAKEGEPRLRFAWNTPFFPSAHGSGVLYCGTQFVMRSGDRGDHWEAISQDLTEGGAILSLDESPLDPGRMISGAGRGRVFVTEDGAAWRLASKGLPDAPIRCVRASRHDPQHLYACLSNAPSGDRRPYVFASSDFGGTWTSLAGTLPVEPVNVIVEDPRDAQILYLGTALGVSCSLDRGATWLSLCQGLPTAPVEDLALPSDGSMLVAVTHGLSALALDVRGVLADSPALDSDGGDER